jgi:dCTP diphosphatase
MATVSFLCRHTALNLGYPLELTDLQEVLHNFAAARSWRRFHNPKNLAASVAIEAAELLECFQWLDDEQSEDVGHQQPKLAEVQDEMADVIIYLLHLADVLNIDLENAVTDKVRRNELRYPVRQVASARGAT